LFRLKSALQGLLTRLAERGQAMSALHLHLSLDHAGHHDERIEPASPTLDVVQIIDLVRLRFDALALPAGIEEVRVEVEGIRAPPDQLTLFGTRRRRDLEAGERALARLRAAFGPEAVTRARLRPAHLPEARFAWEPLRKLTFARPTEVAGPLPLVRLLLPRPLPLPGPPRHEPEAWPGTEPGQGALVRLHGPFRLSGGWWVRSVERDYYYAETQRGDLLWIYWDRPRRRWFLHGRVD
jgi:protein ImuB